MSRRALGLGLGGLALVLGAACKDPKPRTELILGVATDLDAPTPLANISMVVVRLPQEVVVGTQDFPVSGNLNQLYELPGTYAVYSPTGEADRIRVTLQGQNKAGTALVERRAILTMVPGRTLFVRLGIVSACQGKNDCPMGDTCVDGKCLPEEIDTSRLPEYVAGMEKTLACAGATTYVDTSTKEALPVVSTADGGAGCGQGTCSEGVCLSALPGAFVATKGPMTRVRAASFQIGGRPLLLDDGRVLFAGGLDMGSQHVLKATELYDSKTGTFTATGDLNLERVYFGAAKLPNGHVLIVGGINEGGAALGSAELFDPTTGTFVPTKMPMNVARVFPGVTTLASGKVLIVGGMNQIQSYALGRVSYFGGVAEAELYDPATDTFTPTTGRLVEGRAFAQVEPLPGGALVMCGEAQAGPRTTLETFDEATGAFTATALPAGATACISGLNALLPDRKLLLTVVPNHAWLYDTVTKAFVTAADHPGPVPGGVAALIPGSKVLFAGDVTGNQTIGKRAYVFDEASRSFGFVEGELSVAREGAMGTTLPNGDVLIAGGTNDTTAEIFHAAP